MTPTQQTRLYWAAGRARELPGKIERSDLADAVHEATLQYASAIVSSQTSVTLGWMKKSSFLISSTYLGMMNDAQVVADILDAERDGYDVAMIGPNWSPGIRAAREAATIPVAGPLEASMAVTRTIGAKFAYLTVENYGHFITEALEASGDISRAIADQPVREVIPLKSLYESAVAWFEGRSDQFMLQFEAGAKAAIADGADVIVAGGQFFGPALLKQKYFQVPGTGVPVVDPTACALKWAEMLAALRKVDGLEKSQHPASPMRTPPREAIDRARRTFGL